MVIVVGAWRCVVDGDDEGEERRGRWDSTWWAWGVSCVIVMLARVLDGSRRCGSVVASESDSGGVEARNVSRRRATSSSVVAAAEAEEEFFFSRWESDVVPESGGGVRVDRWEWCRDRCAISRRRPAETRSSTLVMGAGLLEMLGVLALLEVLLELFIPEELEAMWMPALRMAASRKAVE